ncbi:hypothetical protein, partial [Desulfovibrio sp.]|uniref:hypothetical protein n=1 Tax=Desulfovibrio sp. TaxID=885 RepID=UPI003FEEC3C1
MVEEMSGMEALGLMWKERRAAGPQPGLVTVRCLPGSLFPQGRDRHPQLLGLMPGKGVFPSPAEVED